MTCILNLSPHPTTDDQRLVGVIDLDEAGRERLLGLLSFDLPPTRFEAAFAARSIAELLAQLGRMPARAMIGGEPFLMPSLERELGKMGVEAVLRSSILPELRSLAEKAHTHAPVREPVLEAVPA